MIEAICPHVGHVIEAICPHVGHVIEAICPHVGHVIQAICPYAHEIESHEGISEQQLILNGLLQGKSCRSVIATSA